MPRTKKQNRIYHRKYMLDRYHKNRAAMVRELGGECAQCGSTEKLEIDHINPLYKTMSVVRMTHVGEERRKEEMENCQVLCSACHQRKSVEEKGLRWARNEHGTLSSYRYCKCDLCRAAKADYMREYRKRRSSNGQDSGLLPRE